MSVPSGTVSFLLTDVVDSTIQWQSHPDSMAEAIRAHESIVRRCLVEGGGYEFGTAGDSFAVAFDSASDAIVSAVAAQRALSAHPWDDVAIGVRIGIHTGAADERDGRYFGPAVNLAARIAALAQTGQVVVTRATAALAERDLPDDVALLDRGDQDLRSFDHPERVFQVQAAGLSNDWVTPVSHDHGLPAPATRFVGREADVAALVELTKPGELVTISGLGGLGKSRTSIEVTRRASHHFGDGSWWIDLAPLADDAFIASLVATTLGLNQQPSMTPEQSVVDGLKRRQALLVFDNCEHLIDGVAGLVAAIRTACPSVGILATSRQPLGISGERNWPLDTMSAESGAIELLIDRATSIDPTFDRHRWPSQDLIDLCDRLDGLPLAIEMAAARLGTLSPAEVIDRLDDRFRLLRSRNRNTERRHQSLMAALDWSYELLTLDERQLLDRLSVFAGSFDLRAVERVCSEDRFDDLDVLDMVTTLLEHSLIARHGASGSTRYRLLETVRHYGDQHLDADERARLRSRQSSYMLDLAIENERRYQSDDRAEFDRSMTVFVDEWDNFRSVFRRAVADDDAEVCDVVLRVLWDVAFQSFRTEIHQWARSALSDLSAPPAPVFGLVGAAVDETEEALRLASEGVAMLDEATPSRAGALCYSVLYWVADATDDQRATAYARRGLFHAPALGRSEVAWQQANLAALLSDVDPVEAKLHADASREYIETTDNPMRTICMTALAMFEANSGRPEIAYQLCHEAAALSRDSGRLWTWTNALTRRAVIGVRFGVGDARNDLVEAIRVGREQRAWFSVWQALSEAVPWFHEVGQDRVADTIVRSMQRRGLAFRGVRLDDGARVPAGPASPGTTIPALRRDDLVDYVLAELSI